MTFLSPGSICYSFDHRANGYGRGEGVVVLVLKMLKDAVRHGNVIRAVIRASGTNQDGHAPGITQPRLSSQEDLIRKVYKSCALDFKSTRYVEAHGKHTPGFVTKHSIKVLTVIDRHGYANWRSGRDQCHWTGF